MSALGTLWRVRILYVVRGETRPQSSIIMIYGLAERGIKRDAERKKNEGEMKKEFLDDIIITKSEEERTKVQEM